MARIRKRRGKDLNILWKVTISDGTLIQNVPLSNLKMEAYDERNNLYPITIISVDADGIHAKFPGEIQKNNGNYRLTLWINKFGDNTSVVDLQGAFELVPYSQMESSNNMLDAEGSLVITTMNIEYGLLRLSEFASAINELKDKSIVSMKTTRDASEYAIGYVSEGGTEYVDYLKVVTAEKVGLMSPAMLNELREGLPKGIKSLNVKYGDKGQVDIEYEKLNGNTGSINIPGASEVAAGVMTVQQVKELEEAKSQVAELSRDVDDVGYVKKDMYNLFRKGNSYINSTGKIITFQNYSIFFFKVNSGDKIHLKYVANPSSGFSIVAFTNTIDDIADDKQLDVIWGGKSSYEDTVYNVQEDGFIATVGWQRNSEYYVRLKKMQSDESGIEEVKSILFNSIDGGNMLSLDKVSSLYIDGVSGKFASFPNYSIYYTTVKKGEVLHVEYKKTPAIEFGLFGFVDNIDDIVAGNYANCVWKEKTSYTALDYVVEKDCVLVFVGSNLNYNEYIEISKKDNKPLIEFVYSLRAGNRVPFRSYNYRKNMFVNNSAEVVSYSGYSIYIYGVNAGDEVELKFNETPDRGFCLVGFVDNINKVVSGSSIDEKIWSGANTYEDTRILIKKDGFLLVCSRVQSPKDVYVIANRVSDIKQYVSKTNNRTIVNILKDDDAITIYDKMYNAFLEENCDVIFEKGEYDVSLVYDYIVNTIKETWTVGLPIGGGCRYFFNGSTLKATRPIGYDGSMNILDTQGCSGDLEINDVTLINNGGTYCIHDECNADKRHSIHTYNNVICHRDSDIAFGCGTGFNGIIKMNNCVFTTGNSSHAILIHSVLESKNPSNIPIDFELFMNGCYVNTKIRFTTFVRDRDKSFVMLNNNYFGTENEGENIITDLKKFNNTGA